MNSSKNNIISFEVFPPKTAEGLLLLNETCKALNQFNPQYISVTFGAAGSSQLRTLEVVEQLVKHNIVTAPHISCIDMSKQRVLELLAKYTTLGIKRLVVIQGDITDNTPKSCDFNYANELVAYIRQHTGNQFHLSVAAYPEFHPRAINPTMDLENFKRKVLSGASSAITQFFFNSDAYFRFLESCEKLGITIPIIPGIMPIHDYIKLTRFAASCDAELPLWFRKSIEQHTHDKAAMMALGIELVCQLRERLHNGGVNNFHFYALNHVEPTTTILKNLNWG